MNATAQMTRAELIAEAGMLNNHPALVNVDHVTIMGLCDRDECATHVEKLRRFVAEANAKRRAA